MCMLATLRSRWDAGQAGRGGGTEQTGRRDAGGTCARAWTVLQQSDLRFGAAQERFELAERRFHGHDNIKLVAERALQSFPQVSE